MKKIITFSTLICMLLSLMTFGARAAITTEVNKEDAAPGEAVVVTIKSEAAIEGLIAVQYSFKYDTNVYEYVGMESNVFDQANPANGELPLLKWDRNEEINFPEGVLAKITLKVLGEAAEGATGAVEVTFEEAVLIGNKMVKETDEEYALLEAVTGAVEVEVHTHAYTEIKYNSKGHWTECTCGDKTVSVAHTFDNKDCAHRSNCTICKYVKLGGEHQVETVKGFDATCTEDGLTDGEKCLNCGEVIKAQEVIKAEGHQEEAYEGDGIKCGVCGEIIKAPTATPQPAKNNTWIWIVLGAVVVLGGAGAAFYFFWFKKKQAK